MKRRPFSLWLLAALAVAAIAASFTMQRASLYPYVVFQSDDTLRLVFLQQARRSEAECRATTGRIVAAVLDQCPACRQLESRCLERLDSRQRKILSGLPVDVPVMRTPGGAIAFLSGTPDLARDVCRDAERQAAGRLPAHCATAGPNDIGLSLATIGAAIDPEAMPAMAERLWLILLAAAMSFITCLLIVRSERLHGRYSYDLTATGPQKFHSVPTPRIGGLAIGAGLWGSITALEIMDWLNPVSAYGLAMLALAAIPAFAGGFGEDVTRKVGVLARLMLTFAAGVFASLLVGATLDRLDAPGLDRMLQLWPLFAIVFTAFCVCGIANSINIIDGYNGLAGGYSLIVLAALAWVAGQVGDPIVLTASLAMLGALAGFLAWNYPRGRIFMGDGGAYLVGFWLAELAVLLVVRNPDVSPWFPLVLLAYPVVDTLFSIYRRKLVRGYSAGKADALHLHQLIYTRLARVGVGSKNPREKRRRNNLVVIYVCAGSLLFIVPALFVWNSTAWLVTLGVAYWAAYLWLYFRLARWRAPAWLIVAPRSARNAGRD